MDSPVTKYGSVAMFDDGANHAQVMARASMGIAEGRNRLGGIKLGMEY